jgi:hypothetical protein
MARVARTLRSLARGLDHEMARRLDLHLREDRKREAENVKTGPEI